MNWVPRICVVSELMRPNAAPAVSAWVQARPNTRLWITGVTQAELWLGARLHSAAVVTRNVAGFEGGRLVVHNPWSADTAS